MNRLLGLGYAVSRRAKRGGAMEGRWEQARKYIDDFQDFAFTTQNADGSWGPYFLSARAPARDAATQLRSTGRALEWLAVSLPDKRLEDSRVTAALDIVTSLLESQTFRANAPALSTRDIASLGHALHALSIYDERVFQPADPPPPPATAQEAEKKGARGCHERRTRRLCFSITHCAAMACVMLKHNRLLGLDPAPTSYEHGAWPFPGSRLAVGGHCSRSRFPPPGADISPPTCGITPICSRTSKPSSRR